MPSAAAAADTDTDADASARPYKIPESVLVVIHTPALDVLMLERVDRPGFWQCVTGSKDRLDEPLVETAGREVLEETGIRVQDLAPGALDDWGLANVYEIYPVWRHRYAPGVSRNTEHVFGLTVPAGTAVELSDGSGDVTATGLRADATLSTDSGMITATDVVGDVRARTGSGDIALSRVTGSLDLGADSGMVDVADASATQVTARTGSGDIHLGLSADPGTVDARADSGHVTVGLPDTAGVAYRLDLNAGSGLTSARVRTDPDSPRSVTVRTGSGDISVGYR